LTSRNRRRVLRRAAANAARKGAAVWWGCGDRGWSGVWGERAAANGASGQAAVWAASASDRGGARTDDMDPCGDAECHDGRTEPHRIATVELKLLTVGHDCSSFDRALCRLGRVLSQRRQTRSELPAPWRSQQLLAHGGEKLDQLVRATPAEVVLSSEKPVAPKTASAKQPGNAPERPPISSHFAVLTERYLAVFDPVAPKPLAIGCHAAVAEGWASRPGQSWSTRCWGSGPGAKADRCWSAPGCVARPAARRRIVLLSRKPP
jgi:hypothetical protein